LKGESAIVEAHDAVETLEPGVVGEVATPPIAEVLQMLKAVYPSDDDEMIQINSSQVFEDPEVSVSEPSPLVQTADLGHREAGHSHLIHAPKVSGTGNDDAVVAPESVAQPTFSPSFPGSLPALVLLGLGLLLLTVITSMASQSYAHFFAVMVVTLLAGASPLLEYPLQAGGSGVDSDSRSIVENREDTTTEIAMPSSPSQLETAVPLTLPAKPALCTPLLALFLSIAGRSFSNFSALMIITGFVSITSNESLAQFFH